MSPFGQPIAEPLPLTAGRVQLRVIERTDAETLQRLLRENRLWLQQWEATHPSGRSVVPGSSSLKPTIKLLRKQLRDGTGVPFVVLYDDTVVGQLSVSEISGGALQSCQIGYWISRHVAGRGIMPTAVALAIDFLFRDVGLHRVEICIRPENEASLRIVEKLGMRYEGQRSAYIHIDGAWRDHESFAVTREEATAGMLARLGLTSG